MSSILVVEDSPTVLYTTSQKLEESGYNVLTARDSEQAVQLAQIELPDLVLLDVILPRVNGYQVCRRLKSTPETAHIPVVMITPKAKDGDRLWGIAQEADDYITKPYEVETLLQAIQKFVQGKDDIA